MTNSKQKGKEGERRLAKEFTKSGFPAFRNEQFCGAENGDPDIQFEHDEINMIVKSFHFEGKYCKNLNVYKAMEQAIRDSSKRKKTPVVCYKRISRTDRGNEWLAILRLSDFIDIIKKLTVIDLKLIEFPTPVQNEETDP